MNQKFLQSKKQSIVKQEQETKYSQSINYTLQNMKYTAYHKMQNVRNETKHNNEKKFRIRIQIISNMSSVIHVVILIVTNFKL